MAATLGVKQKTPSFARGSVGHVQIDQAACFRFLRQPSRPNAPKPVAKSGSAAGSGVSATATPVPMRVGLAACGSGKNPNWSIWVKMKVLVARKGPGMVGEKEKVDGASNGTVQTIY